MTNCLEQWCKFNDIQGGTITQAKEGFTKLEPYQRDLFVSLLVRKMSEISDKENTLWFTRKRNELLGIVTKSLCSNTCGGEHE